MTSQPEYHAWKKAFIAERGREPTPYEAWGAAIKAKPVTQAKPEQPAQPMTDEQINDAYGQARVQHNHIPHDDVSRIVRAVERHHGIRKD